MKEEGKRNEEKLVEMKKTHVQGSNKMLHLNDKIENIMNKYDNMLKFEKTSQIKSKRKTDSLESEFEKNKTELKMLRREINIFGKAWKKEE